VETAIGPLGEQLQQLDQLLAPGACLPEHLQGLIEGSPLAAGAVAARLLRRRSLLEEKQYSWAVSISHWRRSRSERASGSGGAAAAREAAVARRRSGSSRWSRPAAMARLRRSSSGWGGPARWGGNQPSPAPQGGEAGAADPVEVGRLHGEGFEPIGQTAGGPDHPFGCEGAQLLEQLGPSARQALAQIGQHPLAGDAIEHQPAPGRQKGEPLGQLVFELPPAAAQQGPVAQIKAETPVLLANLW
jgi:hypothetical protein